MIIGIKCNRKMETKRSGTKKEGGFTLLEVIMAISILTVGLLAVASMQASAIRGNAISRDYTESTDKVQDVMEKLLSLNFSANELNAGDHTEGELGLDTTDKYSVIWSVQNDTPISGVKTIFVTVQWQERGVQKSHAFAILRNRI
jgi:type IV pilus assembly protein PilV